MASRDRIDWTVTLWDENDMSGEDAASWFEMGLLELSDWRAEWISGDYKPNKKVRYPVDCFQKSVWRGTNAIESWAWAGCDGNKAEVEVYSDAALVELLLNGKSLGKKRLKECKAIFKTKYAPGTLTAVAYTEDGMEQARRELVSATGKGSIAVKPEVTAAKVGEVVYVPVELVGENGIVESNADRKLMVSVQGGELLGFGSANPCHEEQYHTGSFTTHYGRALAVVRVTDDTTVSVTDGTCSASAEILIK